MPINIHYSLLPKYRGASPIQSSLLNGDKVSGVTFMEMSSGLDEGKIIDKYKININQDANKSSLEEDLSELAISKIYEVINNVYSNKYSSSQQEESLATYCKKIKKTDSILNFSSPAETILNKYRAYYSWPGVRFVHKKTMVKISKMHITEEKFNGSVGSIVRFDKSGLYIKTSTKTIVITYLQMPNKNVISSVDAFNAYKQFFC
jgi:methionyl-tRNA formyltransferase